MRGWTSVTRRAAKSPTVARGLSVVATRRVLGIAIDEHLKHITRPSALGNGIARKQDFSKFATVEVEAWT
jgi:hypothetical protein